MTHTQWEGFRGGAWTSRIDVRNFIAQNVCPYDGDERFLVPCTERTTTLWETMQKLLAAEQTAGGVLSIDTETISRIDAFAPGYIDQDLEQIVGLQTDAPLKRALIPFGGIRMVEHSLEAYHETLSPRIQDMFQYRKTHNDGVFDAYTDEMRAARKSGIITGLPDAYGRGRIIGDYRRLPLYGLNALIAQKKASLHNPPALISADTIRDREERAEQIRSLEALGRMTLSYGFDVSQPAKNFHEAVQWLYFAYLAAVKEQNGAAMSLGRVSTFLDIYAERDLALGLLTESEVQELFDQFVLKLRFVRFLRTPAYDALFSGDPVWITESLGGVHSDGRPLVTRSSFRFLHTLVNLGPAPEPNMTVLWSRALPESFKRYAAMISIQTSSIQYENDDQMRESFGDDYGIACCVSPMRLGAQMQFFGARANLAKALLYAINGGRDELSGAQVAPVLPPLTSELLQESEVSDRFRAVMRWLARLYVNTLNVIHYMHDKYAYESLQMAFHEDDVSRTMACGIAGLSVVVDALSAIQYARVRAIRNDAGLATDFEITGDFPTFGNHDPRVDDIAQRVVRDFMEELRKQVPYRNAKPTLSILTITSNVVYGETTGATPDGRNKGEPFAPGANPMSGRDRTGPVAALASVASLPIRESEDGISYTFNIVPDALGKSPKERCDNLIQLLNGYFSEGGHHINVNVLKREQLLHAMEFPELYPQLTIRVSGYAVKFTKLTEPQQRDILNRTFHKNL